MWTRSLIGPCLAFLVVAHVPARAQSDRPVKRKNDDESSNPSHIPVPFRPPAGMQLADFLKDRDHARELREAYEQLKEIIKNDNLGKYIDKRELKKFLDDDGNPPALDDPKAKELVQRWLERARRMQAEGNGEEPQLPFQPNLNAIERLLKDAPKEGGFAPPPGLPPPPSNKPTEMDPSGPGPGDAGPSERPIPPPAQPEPTLEEKGESLQESLANWWKNSPFRNSAAIREFGRKLTQPLIGSAAGADGSDPIDRWQRLGSMIPFKDFFARRLSKPNWSSSGPAPVRSSTTTGSESPESSPVGAVVWIVVAIMVVVLAWKIVSTRRAAMMAGAAAAWRLGPWPLDPSQVATRQDLIRAFEYVSLLLLGPAARSWNHRAIAKRLSDEADTATDRRRAAEHLANLYEKARYAPPADLLPDAEVLDARRDLCLLAGVAQA